MSLPCFLALATVFKGQHEYLAEFVAFHRVVGVEHFHLLCNDDDPTAAREILQPWIDEGVVTFEHWPGRGFVQFEGFDRVLAQLSGQATWALFLDSDELAVPKVDDSLPDFLRRFTDPKICAVLLYWKTFTSNGRIWHPTGQLQIEAYTDSVNPKHKVNATIKSVIRPDLAIRSIGSHFFEYCDGVYPVNELGQQVPQSTHRIYPATHQLAQVNHYITRSRQDYLNKIERGWPKGGGRKVTKDIRWLLWDIHHAASGHIDESALRFAQQTRTELARVGREPK